MIKPQAWLVPQRRGSDYDVVVYADLDGAETDQWYQQEDGLECNIEPLYPVDPNPLIDALEQAVEWIECHAATTDLGHICGPEGNCDMICMEAARDAELICKIREALRSVER